MSESVASGCVLFSEYIDDNILTPLLSRLQVIADDERFHGTNLLRDLDGNQGIRDLMRDLQAVFAGMAKKERSLVHLFDPIERLVDDILESGGADATTLQPKLRHVREQIDVINNAIAESSYSMIFQRRDQTSPGNRGRGGAGDSGPVPTEPICYGEEHIRRAVQGMDMSLRHCLLCLAAFPEGAIIKKRLLIHWWMGEGFVHSLDTGKGHFKQLVKMRFVNGVHQAHCDNAHACTVHPWIRRLLMSIARARAFLMDTDPDYVALSKKNDFSWAQRVFLHEGGEVRQGQFKFHSEVRTIYNVNQKYVRLSDAWFSNKAQLGTMQLGQWRESSASELIDDPKRNHVELIADEHLIMRGIAEEHLIKGIGACRSLRYLSLRGISRIKAIPNAIGKLVELLVLDLSACHNLQLLTKEITKLHKLQYLDVSECYLLVDMPEGLSKLSQLQVLKGFVLASSSRKNTCNLRDLATLTGLRKLTIGIGKKLKRAEVELSVLSQLTSLTSLKITWGMVSYRDGKEQSSNAAAARAPVGFALPPKLSKLELCCFPCQEFAELVNPDGLQRLKRLYVTGGMLRNLSAQSQKGYCVAEVLRLRHLKHLKCDWAELHHLYPKLRFVEATRCPAANDWQLNDRRFWRKSDKTGPSDVSPEN